MIARQEVAMPLETRLAPAAEEVRAQKIVTLAEFRAATVYTAVCPKCHEFKTVHGYATTRPPLCGCNERMVRWG